MPYEHALYGNKYKQLVAQDPQDSFLLSATAYTFNLGTAPPGAGEFIISSLITLSYDLGPWPSPSLLPQVVVNYSLNGSGTLVLPPFQQFPVFTAQNHALQTQFSYSFPTNLQAGAAFQSSININELYSGRSTALIISGQISGSTGVDDYIILSGPQQFSAVHGDPSVNCGQPFCPVVFSAQFIDNEGNGTEMGSWNWKLDIKRQSSGYQTVKTLDQSGGTPYSDFILFAPLPSFPFVTWERNQNGDVPGKVSVSGTDSEGFFHQAVIDVAVSNVVGRLPILTTPGRRTSTPSS